MNGKPESALCAAGSLKDSDVKGNVVLCERGGGIGRIAKGEEVRNAGGAAMILMNEESDGFTTSADAHVLPATHVSQAAGVKIKAYINSTATPTAAILLKRNYHWKPVISHCCFFLFKRPQLRKPRHSQTRNYWTRREHSSRMAFPSRQISNKLKVHFQHHFWHINVMPPS